MSLKNIFCFLCCLIFAWYFLFSPKPVFAAAKISINEFSSQTEGTSTDPDWVEVYYEGVDPALYQIKDETGNTKNLSDVSCSANFCTFGWSNRLNNSGDTIKLILIPSQEIVDQVSYGEGGNIPAPAIRQSAGRDRDGVGNWVIFNSPTKDSSNDTSTPAPTPTPTPSPTSPPTSTPTNPPTPTRTPTPTKTPTTKSSTQSPTSTPTPKTLLTSTTTSLTTKTSVKEETTTLPTSILGTSAAFSSPSATRKPTQEMKKDKSIFFKFPFALMVFGGLFLTACGILAFYSYKQKSRGKFKNTSMI